MGNSYEITRYKQQIMSLFINNEDIVRLIDNKEIENTEDLINENIYYYLRVPDPPEEEKTYICIEVDIPDAQSTYNKLMRELVITIYIITHERLMPTPEGTRTDLLSAEIDKTLSTQTVIGKSQMELLSNNANGIGVKHRCRIMTFTVQDVAGGCN
jgi:hypothetical protein